jgi:hypothetical protein
MAVSNSRRARSWRNGNIAANRYKRANPDAKKSTWHEDVHMHIDFWHDDRGVDVKGNNLPDEIWVEFKNVRGELGWLFGEAEWIAFDMPEVCGFVVVDRVDLKDWCHKNVDFDRIVEKHLAYKKCYQRKDRGDLITKIVLSDLQQLDSYRVIPYCMSYSHPLGGVCYVSDSSIS